MIYRMAQNRGILESRIFIVCLEVLLHTHAITVERRATIHAELRG